MMPFRPLSSAEGHSSNQTYKPNSVAGLATGMTVIPLAQQSLAGSSDLPGGLTHRASTWPAAKPPALPPYLVLLRVGFALPRRLLAGRCALTAPFHPYPACSQRLSVIPRLLGEQAGRYIFCGTFRRPGVPGLPGVTWHTALRSSDFPLPTRLKPGQAATIRSGY